MPASVQIVSRDAAFAASIGDRLHGWGLEVAVETDAAPPAPAGAGPDVVLLDVRRPEATLLGWLAAAKRALPALEVILLVQPGSVAVSIAGMRAGASDELATPFDLKALRRALRAAVRRRRRRLARAGTSLLGRLERAMTAVAFAEEGEHATARELLGERPPAGGRGRRRRARE